MSAEWKRHLDLAEQFNKLGIKEKEQNLGAVQEAIAIFKQLTIESHHLLRVRI